MKWDELADQPCSLARTLAIVGDRWTMMILREAFVGVRRFEQFQDRLGLSKALLSERLKGLVDDGVLERRPYQDRPERFEYRLTPKGLDLYPVLMAMVAWGNKYEAGDKGPPLLHHHKTCGHDFAAVMTCSECGEPLDAREVSVRPGPGFEELLADYGKRLWEASH